MGAVARNNFPLLLFERKDRVGPTDHSFDSKFPNRFYRPGSSLLEAHAMYLRHRHF